MILNFSFFNVWILDFFNFLIYFLFFFYIFIYKCVGSVKTIFAIGSKNSFLSLNDFDFCFRFRVGDFALEEAKFLHKLIFFIREYLRINFFFIRMKIKMVVNKKIVGARIYYIFVSNRKFFFNSLVFMHKVAWKNYFILLF